jgi:hypothetical protein
VIGVATYADPDMYGDPQPLGVPPKSDEGFTWQARHDLASGLKAYWEWGGKRTGATIPAR